MSDLKNPELRIRDLRRIVNLKMQSVVWDSGIEERNEWVYASFESDSYKQKLVDWLESKKVPENTESIWFDPSWSNSKRILWRAVLQQPEDIFCQHSFQIVSVDLDWILGYANGSVARFGRWE